MRILHRSNIDRMGTAVSFFRIRCRDYFRRVPCKRGNISASAGIIECAEKVVSLRAEFYFIIFLEKLVAVP